jgi:hypothetical protein
LRFIDKRGRLLGRVNLFDLIAGAVCLGLVLLAFGAFLLFRVPVPQIASVEPSTVTEHDMEDGMVALRITGQDLRPFLRARLGTFDADFLVQSPTLAEIKLPRLPAGDYDLVLYDESMELVSLPGALTVVAPLPPPPPPLVKVQAVGRFVPLGETQVGQIVVGSRFVAGADGERALVIAARGPEPALERIRLGPTSVVDTPVDGKLQVPAVLQVWCRTTPTGCEAGDARVDGTMDLLLTRGEQVLEFVVDEVLGANASSPFSPPRVMVQALGKFSPLTEAQAGQITVGSRFTAGADATDARVLAVQAPEPAEQLIKLGSNSVIETPIDGMFQVPAILQVRCAQTPEGCRAGGVLVDGTVGLSLARGEEVLEFVVDEVRGTDAPIAFQMRPPPPVTAVVRVLGVFDGLDEAQAREFNVGTRFSVAGMAPVSEIVALESIHRVGPQVTVGPSLVVTTPTTDTVQLPATLAVRCTVFTDSCKLGDATVARNTAIALPIDGRMVQFVVHEVRSVGSEAKVAELLVRFVVRLEVFELLKVGDSDQPAWIGGDGSAVLTAIQDTEAVQTLTYLGLNPDPNRPVQSFEEDAVAFEATVQVPVQGTATGWQYQAEPLKIGSIFLFETSLYTMRGWVLRITLPGADASAENGPS